jgi:hypothetical protein
MRPYLSTTTNGWDNLGEKKNDAINPNAVPCFFLLSGLRNLQPVLGGGNSGNRLCHCSIRSSLGPLRQC